MNLNFFKLIWLGLVEKYVKLMEEFIQFAMPFYTTGFLSSLIIHAIQLHKIEELKANCKIGYLLFDQGKILIRWNEF